MQTQKGRPAGSPNKNAGEVTVEKSRCPKCGSTERAPYHNRHEQEFGGIADGKVFTHIIRQRTHCTGCGQHRIDRTLENRTAKKRAA